MQERQLLCSLSLRTNSQEGFFLVLYLTSPNLHVHLVWVSELFIDPAQMTTGPPLSSWRQLWKARPIARRPVAQSPCVAPCFCGSMAIRPRLAPILASARPGASLGHAFMTLRPFLGVFYFYGPLVLRFSGYTASLGNDLMTSKLFHGV